MVAILLSTLIPYFLTFIPLKEIFTKQINKFKFDKLSLLSYGLPSAIAIFSLTSLISTDIMMAKHFFDPTKAGIYAGLSLSGRVIFFFTSTIPMVMFPLIVQKHERKENYVNTFKLSILLILIISSMCTIFYFIFPKFVITTLLKKDYLEIVPLVGLFAIFITVYSLLSVLTNFYLSIKKTLICIPILIGAILQVVLIYIFHQNYLELIITSLSISFLLLISLLLYYPYATKK